MQYHTQYWKDEVLLSAFKTLLYDIHQLDFSLLIESGFWDDNYVPFTFFKDGKAISNVCIYSVPCIINGEEKQLAQVSGVGTLPEFRKQGLNRELTKRAIEWAKNQHEFFFLFADDEAVDYYDNGGFTPIKQYLIRQTLQENQQLPFTKKPLEKLGLERLDFIAEAVEKRSPVSNIFATMSLKLTMFHVLYTLPDHLYYIKELDTIIAMEQKKNCLAIYDLIAPSMPSLEMLLPFIINESINELEFHFYPDQLGVNNFNYIERKGYNPFLKGNLSIKKPLVFPYTIYA